MKTHYQIIDQKKDRKKADKLKMETFNDIENLYLEIIKATFEKLSTHALGKYLKREYNPISGKTYINSLNHIPEILNAAYHFTKNKNIIIPRNIELNQNAIIYQTIRGICQTKDQEKINNIIKISNPLIKSYRTKETTHYIETKHRKITFQRIIEDENDQTYKILKEDPQLSRKCHQYTFFAMTIPKEFFPQIGENKEAVTSYIAYYVKLQEKGKNIPIGYLHSYIEKDGIVYDLTGNVKMSKSDFEYLNNPEEVSRVKKEDFEQIDLTSIVQSQQTERFNEREFFLNPTLYLQDHPQFQKENYTRKKVL